MHSTDFIWSKNTSKLDRTVQDLGNYFLHYLQGGSDRAFAQEKLMHIPEHTQVPPEWLSKWKQRSMFQKIVFILLAKSHIQSSE